MDKLLVVDPALLSLSSDQFAALVPYFLLLASALLAMVLGVIRFIPAKWSVFGVALVGIILAIAASARQVGMERLDLFGGMMAADGYSAFFNVLFLGTAGLSLFPLLLPSKPLPVTS